MIGQPLHKRSHRVHHAPFCCINVKLGYFSLSVTVYARACARALMCNSFVSAALCYIRNSRNIYFSCMYFMFYLLFIFENRTWLQLLYHLHAASKTQQLHTRCIWCLSPLISLLFLPFMIKRPENKQHADLQPYNELWGEKKPAEVAVCHERLCFYFCDVNWMQCRIQVSRWQCNARENV